MRCCSYGSKTQQKAAAEWIADAIDRKVSRIKERTEPRDGSPVDYVPLTWPADTLLSVEERAHVDRERLALWNHGVRREPQLTRMAFEFGAVASMVCGIKPKKKARR